MKIYCEPLDMANWMRVADPIFDWPSKARSEKEMRAFGCIDNSSEAIAVIP